MGKILTHPLKKLLKDSKKDGTLVEFSDKELDKFKEDVSNYMDCVNKGYLRREANSSYELNHLTLNF